MSEGVICGGTFEKVVGKVDYNSITNLYDLMNFGVLNCVYLCSSKIINT